MKPEEIKQLKALRGDAEVSVAAGELDEAVHFLEQAERLAKADIDRLSNSQEIDSQEDREAATELVETYGVHGGVLRRKGDFSQALNFYRRGADLEDRLKLQSTYNRVNAIKWALRLGVSDSTTLSHEIKKTLHLLNEQTNELNGPRRRDAWAFSDVGDCQALLGDRDAALNAYKRFLELSDTEMPSSALDVLREIRQKLPAYSDPRTAVDAVVEFLEKAT